MESLAANERRIAAPESRNPSEPALGGPLAARARQSHPAPLASHQVARQTGRPCSASFKRTEGEPCRGPAGLAIEMSRPYALNATH